jgi:hypothetical protein
LCNSPGHLAQNKLSRRNSTREPAKPHKAYREQGVAPTRLTMIVTNAIANRPNQEGEQRGD